MSRASAGINQVRRRIRWFAGLSVGVTLLLGPVAAQAHAAPPVEPKLAHEALVNPDQTVFAIVQFRPGTSQEKAVRKVESMGGQVVQELPIIRGLAVQMSAQNADKLGHDKSVHAASINSKAKSTGLAPTPLASPFQAPNLATTYPLDVGAPQAWKPGATGVGVGVAVIDSGIAGNLADFQGPGGASRVVGSAVVSPGASDASDPFGHGTMVAGIIGGNGENLPSSDPSQGLYEGIAPNANLVSIKVGDDQANASVLDVINGIQFAIQHQADYNIKVINLSLASTVAQSATTDPLDAAVESAWQHGITVVAAAGNQGNVPGAVNYAPANDPFVITVGAVDDRGTAGPGDDVAAGYSSVGVTQDGFAKPEVYAPGSHIISVLAPNSAFTQLCPSCIQGGEYIKASGTSFAAPVVAGAVADMLQQNPGLTPNQVKGALVATAGPVGGPGSTTKEVKLGPALKPNNNVANEGLTPNTQLDSGGNIVDWSGSSFIPASNNLVAGYARSSWSCDTCTGSSVATDPTRSRWSRSSWSRSSWSQSSWSQSSWSQSSWSVFWDN